jgi:3-deoxy-D-manno-octulosonate 8-phosphate phosphatase (KDO 8-P phosphatase)
VKNKSKKSLPDLSTIKLLAFDVDGVFTDGRFYLSDDGVETKAFCTQDGYGVRQAMASGIEIAVISGRKSRAVERRMLELGVAHVVLGSSDKVTDCDHLRQLLQFEWSNCAYVGDDNPDLPLLRKVGFSVAVANAVVDVQNECDYTTTASGGFGAVREVCDMVRLAHRRQ